ncbi:ankyrin [Jackrogersella minutella]|nr:ankyrin [Jackrogersella minutella]
MATKKRKIPDVSWDNHKEVILNLYLTSDFSLGKLVRVMNEDHGFSATISQFEAQLRVWKARKNLKRHDWERILKDIDHLASQDIQFRVLVSGHPLPMNRIDRARRYLKSEQHGKRRRNETYVPDATDDCADSDILIETQDQTGEWSQYTPVDGRATFHRTQRNSAQASDIDMQEQPADDDEQAGNLNPSRTGVISPQFPSFDVSETIFNDWLAAGGDRHFSPSTDLSFISPIPPISLSPLQHRSDVVIAFPPEEVVASPLPPADFVQFPFGTLFLDDLPSEQFERKLISQGLRLTPRPSPIQDSRLLFGAQKLASIFLHEAAAAMTSKNEKSLQDNFHRAGLTLQTLETIIPRAYQGFENRMVRFPQGQSDVDLHRLLILSAANGFVGMGNIPIETVFRFLDHNSNVTSILSRFFQGNTTPFAKSLAENLFRAAIEACDHQKTRFFLETGLIDVNNIFCFVDGKKYTPLERAAELQGLEIIHQLLRYKPDVNGTVLPQELLSPNDLRRALRFLIKGNCPRIWKERSHSPFTSRYVETVDALVEAGADINVSSIYMALKGYVRMELAHKLLLKFAPSRHSEAISTGILKYIAEEFTDVDAKKAITKILSDCEQTSCQKCLNRFSDKVHWAIMSGAKRGHVQLIRSLFQHAKSGTAVLSAAIRSGSQELVDFVLDQNPDIRGAPAEELGEGDASYTTPLADAIEKKDDVLIRILENKGALEFLGNKDDGGVQFSAAISAASRVGDINYLKRVISVYPHDLTFETYEAVRDAIAYKQEDISLLLLDVGVSHMSDVSIDTMIGAYRWANKSVLDSMSKIPGAISHMPYNITKNIKPGDMGMLSVICKSGRASRALLYQCLSIAVEHGDLAFVHQLLELEPGATNEELLATAVRRHPDMLRTLLSDFPKRKNPISGLGTLVVNQAIQQHNIEALEMLLNSAAVDLETPASGRFSDTAEHSQVAPLALLIERDAACGTKFLLTPRLLSAGCNINGIVHHQHSSQPCSNLTPLLVAINTRNRHIVQSLIDRGANVNREPTHGIKHTPLQLAARNGSLDIVELLLQHGADVNAKAASLSGGTALQCAAMSGNCNIAAILLDHGANLYAPPSIFNGVWPLEGAAMRGRLDMVQFLWNVSLGGFPVEQCRKAVQLAKEEGHGACRDLILQLAAVSGIMLTLEG